MEAGPVSPRPNGAALFSSPSFPFSHNVAVQERTKYPGAFAVSFQILPFPFLPLLPLFLLPAARVFFWEVSHLFPERDRSVEGSQPSFFRVLLSHFSVLLSISPLQKPTDARQQKQT